MKTESYLVENGRWVKATKWKSIKNKIRNEVKRWKLVDTYSNRIIPISEMHRFFVMSPREWEDAQKIYKEKGTLAYVFFPCGGIAWGVKIRVLDTGEEIDVTDVDSW